MLKNKLKNKILINIILINILFSLGIYFIYEYKLFAFIPYLLYNNFLCLCFRF